MPRPYQQKKRAERAAETRQRIVDAAVELHTTLGPVRTPVAAIAERAGVQRHTVYAHFPDTSSLLAACTAHWAALHPFPDPERFEELGNALDAVYDWYASVEDDMALFGRDAAELGELEPEQVRLLTELRRRLARGRSRRARAAIGHALEFETWRSLVRRQGLSRRTAVDLMVRLVDNL
jgi:AcrR family transcriptional regulator